MKKSIACMMALVMAVSILVMQPLPVRAQTTTTTDKTKAATADGVIEMNATAQSLSTGSNGEVVVTLAFKLEENEMMTGFEGYVRYDENALYAPTYELATISGTGTEQLSLALVHLDNTRAGLDRILVREIYNRSFKPQNVLLTIRFWVVRSVGETTITFDMPKIYNGSTYAIRNYTKGLSVSVRNPSAKQVTLQTNNVFGNNLVTIPVRLTGNTGFRNITLAASYDQTKLKCISISPDDSVSTKLVQRGSMQDKDGVATMTYTATEQISTSGNLFNCTFQILNKSTSTGTSTGTGTGTIKDPELTEVMFEIKEMEDYQGSAFDLVNAKAKSIVTITEGTQLLGDVNGDSKIDLVDALYVIQFYNGVRKSLTSAQHKAADVNNDGKVNLLDARIILEYYNGKRLYL